MKKKGIETYVLILPNRENIYKEKLPSSIPIKSDVSKAEDLINYIEKNSDIDIIYPKEELIAAKEDYQVYRKYDTHWNDVGAFIGTVVLQRNIDPNFEYDLNNIEIEYIDEKEHNGLAVSASLSHEFLENTVKIKDFYTNIQCTVETIGWGDLINEEYVSNSTNNKTVLFVGDSFGENMKEYFSKLYRKVFYIHRNDYNKELIENLKPDIVVIEVVERFSGSISKKLF